MELDKDALLGLGEISSGCMILAIRHEFPLLLNQESYFFQLSIAAFSTIEKE